MSQQRKILRNIIKNNFKHLKTKKDGRTQMNFLTHVMQKFGLQKTLEEMLKLKGDK
jgi:hypothetical protein